MSNGFGNRLPDPRKYSNWLDWAKDVEKASYAGSAIQPVQAQTVLLEHMVADRPASAAVDGLLMFDPVQGCPVYSEGGSWHPLTVP